MAKINHNNAFETINNWIEQARESGAVHLYAQDKSLSGKELLINGKKCFHFATTGYLGLEQDGRIKKFSFSSNDIRSSIPVFLNYLTV